MILLVERFAFGFLRPCDSHDSRVLPDLLNQIDKVEVVVGPISRLALVEDIKVVDSRVDTLDREFAEPQVGRC